MDRRATQISGWLRDRISDAGARGLVALVTGDVDSAVAIRLCQLAAPGQTLAALLPCHDDPADEHDARLVADHFGVPALRVDSSRRGSSGSPRASRLPRRTCPPRCVRQSCRKAPTAAIAAAPRKSSRGSA